MGQFEHEGPTVRSLNRDAKGEIELVARRMRETLAEVLGKKRGENLYSLEWLERRVCDHLDPEEIIGEVFLDARRLRRALETALLGWFSRTTMMLTRQVQV